MLVAKNLNASCKNKLFQNASCHKHQNANCKNKSFKENAMITIHMYSLVGTTMLLELVQRRESGHLYCSNPCCLSDREGGVVIESELTPFQMRICAIAFTTNAWVN